MGRWAAFCRHGRQPLIMAPCHMPGELGEAMAVKQRGGRVTAGRISAGCQLCTPACWSRGMILA